MSAEHVIVDEKIADEFAAKLAARVAALPAGDPRKGDLVRARRASMSSPSCAG
jgi:benzaldehyde dehydrogenase (NAD)